MYSNPHAVLLRSSTCTDSSYCLFLTSTLICRVWPAPEPPASLAANGAWLAAQIFVGLAVYALCARLMMPSEWRAMSERIRRR